MANKWTKENLDALKVINKIANQRFAWKRNSNEDNEGWLQIGDIASQAIAKAERINKEE